MDRGTRLLVDESILLPLREVMMGAEVLGNMVEGAVAMEYLRGYEVRAIGVLRALMRCLWLHKEHVKIAQRLTLESVEVVQYPVMGLTGQGRVRLKLAFTMDKAVLVREGPSEVNVVVGEYEVLNQRRHLERLSRVMASVSKLRLLAVTRDLESWETPVECSSHVSRLLI